MRSLFECDSRGTRRRADCVRCDAGRGTPAAPTVPHTCFATAGARLRQPPPCHAPPQRRREKRDFGRLSSVYEPTGSVVTIGRDRASDIVLADDPRASRRHAELRLGADGSWLLKDVGSHNGTFLNGERISQAYLTEGDIVALGNHLYRFRQRKLEEFSATDDASLDVARLKVVTEGGTTLLEDVAFSLRRRSVLAIVGPRKQASDASSRAQRILGTDGRRGALRRSGSVRARTTNCVPVSATSPGRSGPPAADHPPGARVCGRAPPASGSRKAGHVGPR